jgi:hypothetical protein
MRQFTVDDVKIGAADPAGRDLDQDFAMSRLWNRPLPHHQRRIRSVKHHRPHEGYIEISGKAERRRNSPVGFGQSRSLRSSAPTMLE